MSSFDGDFRELVAQQPPDWSRPYIGAMVSFSSGESAYEFDTTPKYDLMNATRQGGFTGYNFQRGNLVFGAEAAPTTGAGVGYILTERLLVDVKYLHRDVSIDAGQRQPAMGILNPIKRKQALPFRRARF